MTHLLNQLLEALAAAAQDNVDQPEHARAFAQWIHLGQSRATDILAALGDAAAAANGPARESKHVAVLGYASHGDARFQEPFVDALNWLRQRSFFVPGRPLAFEVDGIALLGVALGVSRLPTATATEPTGWLRGLLARQPALGNPTGWNDALVAAASEVVGHAANAMTPDLRAALAERLDLQISEADQEAAWALIAEMRGIEDGMTRAATQQVALHFLLKNSATIRPSAFTVEQVVKLLTGVSAGLRHWTWEEKARTPNSAIARWDVENEYHVQNLLWAVMAPVFPNLDDEEWLKSLGHHKPRADFAVPSLHLIVEAKFLRSGKNAFSQVIEEVAADASTYLQQGSPYRHIIVVVWDDFARTEEHAELRKGLLRISGIRGAVVIPRPAKMARHARKAAPQR
jgi:hypothetical protein